jgi:tRNA threonylcarbamoyl adenosine modification protein (Sua5/YciO/YrdC/YwlC family)
MILEVHPDNPNSRYIAQAVKCLKQGGVIIYPTDTVYAFGCDINSKNAVEKICKLRNIKPSKANFSFICNDLSQLSEYAKQVSTPTFRVMKHVLPGPYTFILNASSLVPQIFKSKKKTVGIRVPNNKIAQALVEELGNPIMSASLKDEDEFVEYTTDPSNIYNRYQNQVDLILNGGYGNNAPSTVLNCVGDEPEVIRKGLGSVDFI